MLLIFMIFCWFARLCDLQDKKWNRSQVKFRKMYLQVNENSKNVGQRSNFQKWTQKAENLQHCWSKGLKYTVKYKFVDIWPWRSKMEGQRSNFQNAPRRLKIYICLGQRVPNILLKTNLSICDLEGQRSNIQNAPRRLKIYICLGQRVPNIQLKTNLSICDLEGQKWKVKGQIFKMHLEGWKFTAVLVKGSRTYC